MRTQREHVTTTDPHFDSRGWDEWSRVHRNEITAMRQEIEEAYARETADSATRT